MGQKVNPVGFRLGVYRNWDARWYADKDYTKLLHEDLAMRRLITGRLRNAGLARIETERSANQLTIIIQTAKPGIVIGKQGASVDALRDELERISGKKVRVTIHEIKSPEVDAKLVAESVASQLEKRIAFRRAIKQSIMRTMRAGAKGVKIQVSGRLGGSEMSRREWDRDGRVPLHTLRANIDYGQAEARTTFGRIGVTVWIYKGDFVTATGEPILPGGDGRAREDGGDGQERPRRAPAGRPDAPRPEPRASAPAPAPARAAAPAAAPAAPEATAAPAPARRAPAPAPVAEPEPAPEPEPEASAVVEEVDDDVDTTEEVEDEVIVEDAVDDIADELSDVDISGIDIPDPDATPSGPEGGPKRAPARRKPLAPRKPGVPPRAVKPQAEED
jgi:small subunit ribosomal protein S3